jgi:hypothetical protein
VKKTQRNREVKGKLGLKGLLIFWKQYQRKMTSHYEGGNIDVKYAIKYFL